jgi:eukaryotic-like serine/threonine-protein kinase
MSVVEQFGKYLLLEKVAAGGMAEVYLAKSTGVTGLNKFFAIKRILPQFSSNEEFVEMFKEEANVAINLNHSNVVSIFDFGIEKGQFYLVMDYVEGRNLRQIINELKKANKSFSIDQALFMVKEAAAGLDHAHRCTDSKSGRPLNITHRDMSPQNIMVSFEGEVKVIDFGIAKAETEQEETKAGTLKGKFGYMSPEQAEGMPIDPRTDVFALGIVLWELLANDRLFTGSNEAAILRKVRDCQVPSIRKVNPTVPPELERIVMKALAKDRNVRYQTAANFHRDLNRFLNTQFPDFSPQDFSQFIRDSFKAAYQQGKNKLIEYSNVKATNPLEPQLPKVPSSEAVQASLEKGDGPPQPPSEPLNGLPPPIEGNQEVSPAAFNVDPNLVKVSLDGVLNADMGQQLRRAKNNRAGAANSAAAANGVAQNTALRPNHFNKTSITSLHQTRVTQKTQFPISSSGNEDFMNLAIKFVIVLAFLFGGNWAYQNFVRARPSERMAQVPVQNPNDPTRIAKNDNGGVIEQPSLSSVKVSINSTPPGAKVFLDGKDTPYYTPAIISVTANQPARFTIRKEGYLEYEISQTFSATGSIAATLQPTARAGYLNIYLSNGGDSTKIYVNGKELSEKPPVKKYPILADAETVIRAFNPFTELSDEVVIKLSPGENKNIELILGRTKDKLKK